MTKKDAMQNEMSRLEEDCTYSAKTQFNASARWNRYNYIIGISSAIFSTISASALIKNNINLFYPLSMASSILTTILFTLKPSEKSNIYKNSGNKYLHIRNELRYLKDIFISEDAKIENFDAKFEELRKKKFSIDESSLMASSSDFKQAQKGIINNEAKYIVDTKVS